MKFITTPLDGVFVIELEKKEDSRGYFARTWDEKVFKKYKIYRKPVQTNMSYSIKKGTMRGLHYQVPPHEETKLIRCVRGSIFDVIIDIRKNSPTYKKWFGIKLSHNNYKALFLPEGFAHGFLTLEDDTEVVYQVSDFYMPNAEKIIRYNDPAFNIKWPIEVTVTSEKDRVSPDFKE